VGEGSGPGLPAQVGACLVGCSAAYPKLDRVRVTGWRHRFRAVDRGPCIAQLGYGLVSGLGDGSRRPRYRAAKLQ
jgi:hypothetical protein